MVFPEPVGPVISTIPNGFSNPFLMVARVGSSRSKLSKFLSPVVGSSTRMAIFSPSGVGNVATRKSMSRSKSFARKRPSCGTRFSSIFKLEITFTRDVIGWASSAGSDATSRRSPSMRKRMRNDFCCGSMCTSDALFNTASLNVSATILMIGASALSPPSSSIAC